MEDSAADHSGIEEALEGHDEIKDWSLDMLDSSEGRSMRRQFQEMIFAGWSPKRSVIRPRTSN